MKCRMFHFKGGKSGSYLKCFDTSIDQRWKVTENNHSGRILEETLKMQHLKLGADVHIRPFFFLTLISLIVLCNRTCSSHNTKLKLAQFK